MPTELENQIVNAVYRGDTDEVRKLLAQHPEMVRHECGAGTWLHVAAGKPSLDMARMLIDLGCDVNAERSLPTRESPLNNAIGKDNPEMVRLLLEHGANPNPPHSRHVVAALAGNKKNSVAILKLLEQYGADLHREFIHHGTQKPINALSEAIAWNKPDAVEYLKSKGAVMPDQPPPTKKEPQTLSEEVVAHFSRHFGTPDRDALIEIVPTIPPIAVHFIPSTPERNFITLFTTGMSANSMKVPNDFPHADKYQFAELFLQLPGGWPYRDIEDPRFSWPVHWLRSMGKYPYLSDTWLGGPVAVVANGDPAEPLAPNVRFDAMLMMAAQRFTSRDGRTIQLYRMTPLYPEERELEAREGIGALLRALDAQSTPFMIDLNRPSAVTR